MGNAVLHMHFHFARAATQVSIPLSRVTGLHAEWLMLRSFPMADKETVKLHGTNAYFGLRQRFKHWWLSWHWRFIACNVPRGSRLEATDGWAHY